MHRPCRDGLAEALEINRLHVPGIFNGDCVADYSQPCPARFSLEGQFCQAPLAFSGMCGFSVPVSYNPQERAAYAETCLTPWPCEQQTLAL